MKRSLVVLAAVAVLGAAVCESSRLSATPASSSAGREAGFLRLPPAAAAGEFVIYGHIKSLSQKGNRFVRFDPAWFLSGVTANRAAAEDKVIPPGDVVPNDNHLRDESHRLLTYLVPVAAHATILTNAGAKGIFATRISVSELAQIVVGNNPRHRRLFEPMASGVWIRVAVDTVRPLDQQYRP